MTDVVSDFDHVYNIIRNNYNLNYYLNCADRSNNVCTIKYLQERKSYFCCAVDESTGRCVLHRCVLIVFGTWLDKKFRKKEFSGGDATCGGGGGDGDQDQDAIDERSNIKGTFMIDGRFLSFPNVMMNNNILMHNFYDKLYSKNCKRMFLYGNVDEEKRINRAIQLVYDDHEDVLFARDVYAKDYVVSENLNETLETYLRSSGKWEPLNFLFDFDKNQTDKMFDRIKMIMRAEINYSIDSLSNKIIYKHAYLTHLLYRPVLKMYQASKIDSAAAVSESNGSLRKLGGNQSGAMYPKDCKKIVDTIVNGKLIHVISKTFSKQKKNFLNHQDNSSNNNIEMCPPMIKYRVGNEVVRIINDNMRQDMLKQEYDFVKFVDSFFHGEMTVAGKKFFLCRDVRLPNVDYESIAKKFKDLIESNLIVRRDEDENGSGGDDDDDEWLMIAFNNRPTTFSCKRKHLVRIVYEFKRKRFPVEIKLSKSILFVNHHEGMICIRKQVRINEKVNISALLTPYEYHNVESIIGQIGARIVDVDHVSALMSKTLQYYYRSHLHIFATIPVPKLIVSVTNLKNAMPVIEYDDVEWNENRDMFIRNLPVGNSVVASPGSVHNNKMINLWTLVRDSRLMTAEDPYIPNVTLPVKLFNNKVNRLKGKMVYASKSKTPLVKFFKSESNNFVDTNEGHVLAMAGVIVSNVKINWTHDGKRYKIETCKNKSFYIFKIYTFLRKIRSQRIELIDAKLSTLNDFVYVKFSIVTSTNNLDGIKICGIHGQKGVMNSSEDLTEWMAEDGTHAQICLSPVSFLSRQSNFDYIERKYVVRGGDHTDPSAVRYPMFRIPYMLFNNTPEILQRIPQTNYTGHEKIEGTRLDQWSINQSFAGNRWAEGLQCVRGGTNLPDSSGEYKVLTSLLHCNNVIVN
uniref:Probable DNA-directed RNA polymerase subunit beta n=6 Tax=Spodoptera littoralis nuclear polyhedrosis virus TaxID=10456 RepID=RPOB_NPVSL|nr:RecName: Full=Probable DNA-directed RNA polymerase subunit beta; AltName: Full=Late expression factor 8 [Spodoptera littoralis nucleopolyhedrovirus]CAA71676.1 lef-8 [Spodoptera littoralis nucleopolyhedrovirus]